MTRKRSFSRPPRAWQRMLSGRRLDLLDPSPLDIEIEDIAHGLARVARWNGQTVGDHAFSVAQHCVVVEAVCKQLDPALHPRWSLAALLHDASEYVIGDMISPFKAALGDGYKSFEERLEHAVHARFGIPGTVPADIKRLIKQGDRISAYFEATQLAGFNATESAEFFGTPPDVIQLFLVPLPTRQAQHAYLDRFGALLTELDGAARPQTT